MKKGDINSAKKKTSIGIISILISLVISIILCISLIVEINAQKPPYNLAGAWPEDMMAYYLGQMISMIIVIIGVVLLSPDLKNISPAGAILIMILFTINLAFMFDTTVIAMGLSYDRGIVIETINRALLYFAIEFVAKCSFLGYVQLRYKNRAYPIKNNQMTTSRSEKAGRVDNGEKG